MVLFYGISFMVWCSMVFIYGLVFYGISMMVWCFMVFLLWFCVLWHFLYGLVFYGISCMVWYFMVFLSSIHIYIYIYIYINAKKTACTSLPEDEHLDVRSMSKTLQIN